MRSLRTKDRDAEQLPHRSTLAATSCSESCAGVGNSSGSSILGLDASQGASLWMAKLATTQMCVVWFCRRQQELQWRRPYCFHNMTIIFHYSMTRNKRVSKSNFRKGHVILVAKHHQRPDLFLRIVACSEVALGVTRRHRSHMSYGQYSWLITIKNGASHPMVHRDL